MKRLLPLEQQLTELNEQAFLGLLRIVFPISRIYYPGCGDDDILEGPFTRDEIVYLDNDPHLQDTYRGGYNFF